MVEPLDEYQGRPQYDAVDESQEQLQHQQMMTPDQVSGQSRLALADRDQNGSIHTTTPNVGSKPLFKVKPGGTSGFGGGEASSAKKPSFGVKPSMASKKPIFFSKKKFEMKDAPPKATSDEPDIDSIMNKINQR
jgi:hypothetical protein